MPRSVAPLLVLCLALALSACGGGGPGTTDLSPLPPPDGGQLPPDGGTPPSSTMGPQELAFANEVLVLVNIERQIDGLEPLVWDDGAAQVAYAHSVDMDVRDFFDHTNPDGELPWDRLSAAGISWSTAGENIAWGHPSPSEVMLGWMNSPGHRANILNVSFTRLGVGVHSAPGGIYWTQLFYTP